ncbi:hypothetical protein CYMTET_18071, partial [Cymbomonas tetramitiformis]
YEPPRRRISQALVAALRGQKLGAPVVAEIACSGTALYCSLVIAIIAAIFHASVTAYAHDSMDRVMLMILLNQVFVLYGILLMQTFGESIVFTSIVIAAQLILMGIAIVEIFRAQGGAFQSLGKMGMIAMTRTYSAIVKRRRAKSMMLGAANNKNNCGRDDDGGDTTQAPERTHGREAAEVSKDGIKTGAVISSPLYDTADGTSTYCDAEAGAEVGVERGNDRYEDQFMSTSTTDAAEEQLPSSLVMVDVSEDRMASVSTPEGTEPISKSSDPSACETGEIDEARIGFYLAGPRKMHAFSVGTGERSVDGGGPVGPKCK